MALKENNLEANSQVEMIGVYAGLLSSTEIGFGSLLHAFHVPFTGHFLSLNQIFILTRASKEGGKQSSRFSPGVISFVSAVLKSLSPIGKKLTPMLAISMQGLLFNLGILLFGHSLLGRLVGANFAALWGFVQPLLLYYIIFGKSLFDALTSLIKDFSQFVSIDQAWIYYSLAGLIALKLLLANTIVIGSEWLNDSWVTKYIQKISNSSLQKVKPATKENRAKAAVKGAMHDLCKPLFLIAIIFTALFFFMIEGDFTALLWHVMRPIAIGFLVFFSMRILPLEKIALWLESRHASTLGRAFKIALEKVRKI
jgi:hypothetical protein